MRRLAPLAMILLVGACSAPRTSAGPSLAPRPAEAIDPRVPIPGSVEDGPVDAALAAQLGQLVGEVRAGVTAFDAKLANAERLAAGAGPTASESWIAAQQALSILIEQFGVTSRAAANIDDLASKRIEGQHWIRPVDQHAITIAAAEVSAISDRQSAAIDRLKDRLAR